uniref:Thioredoxin n=1 Tax=Strongyloides venezuelensis TaxID=75913 RepID=A0A0K0FJ27_STRVS
MAIRNITTKKELDKIFSNSKEALIVIDFYAAWCGPCKLVAPHFQKFSQKYTDVVFIKVDIDDADELAELYEIKVMPTFYFIKNGVTITSLEGNCVDEIKATIENHK